MKKQYRALLIEDDPACMKAEMFLLQACGFLVDTVTNAMDAVDLIGEKEASGDQSPYDIIFTDIQLPDLNGHFVVEILQDTGLKKTVPVIAITAYFDQQQEYKKKGIVDVIEKPLTIEVIERLVLKYLN